MARILVFGSRNYDHLEKIHRAIREQVKPDDTIVHGGATGADTMAGYTARKMNIQVEAHPPNWKKHGRAAGPIRNQEMLDSGIDRAIGFSTDGPGSQDMIRRLRAAGIPMILYP